MSERKGMYSGLMLGMLFGSALGAVIASYAADAEILTWKRKYEGMRRQNASLESQLNSYRMITVNGVQESR